MRINRKLSYIRLLVPVLLLAGVQAFAQAATDSRMPVPGPVSSQTTRPHADVFVISDRTSLMKSIQEIMRDQGFKSQSAGMSCSASIFSVRLAESFFSGSCAFIDCAAPPPGCSYQNPPRDKNGCLTGCGTLVCGPEI
jgi:hypothetical protein